MLWGPSAKVSWLPEKKHCSNHISVCASRGRGAARGSPTAQKEVTPEHREGSRFDHAAFPPETLAWFLATHTIHPRPLVMTCSAPAASSHSALPDRFLSRLFCSGHTGSLALLRVFKLVTILQTEFAVVFLDCKYYPVGHCMAASLPFRAQLCREKPSLNAPPEIPSLRWSLPPTLTGLLPGKHRGHSHASRLLLLAAVCSPWR